MKQVQSVLRYFSLLLFAFTLTACAGLQADTFNKKMASAYVGVSTAAQLTQTAYTAGKISAGQKVDVAAKLDTVLAALRSAESAHATSPALGDDKLQNALVLIGAVQAFLATQGVK